MLEKLGDTETRTAAHIERVKRLEEVARAVREWLVVTDKYQSGLHSSWEAETYVAQLRVGVMKIREALDKLEGEQREP